MNRPSLDFRAFGSGSQPASNLESVSKRQMLRSRDLGREGQRERARGREWEEHSDSQSVVVVTAIGL